MILRIAVYISMYLCMPSYVSLWCRSVATYVYRRYGHINQATCAKSVPENPRGNWISLDPWLESGLLLLLWLLYICMYTYIMYHFVWADQNIVMINMRIKTAGKNIGKLHPLGHNLISVLVLTSTSFVNILIMTTFQSA